MIIDNGYADGFEHEFGSFSEEKSFAREELIYNVTEDILVIMEDMAVSKADLAKKLGKSKSYVTQVLSGKRNMTLGSFSDICVTLGIKPKITLPVDPKGFSDDEVFDVDDLDNEFFDASLNLKPKLVKVPTLTVQRDNIQFVEWCDVEHAA